MVHIADSLTRAHAHSGKHIHTFLCLFAQIVDLTLRVIKGIFHPERAVTTPDTSFLKPTPQLSTSANPLFLFTYKRQYKQTPVCLWREIVC